MAKSTFLVVGHQPMLGRTVARLLGLQSGECAIGKGAMWWLRHRQSRDDKLPVQEVAVMSADLL